ncbi:MAG: methyltransferase domain-containing protein [Alphaproteobacteria bacterium]
MSTESYAIEGGVEGRDRLKLLSRVFGAATKSLLDRVGLQPGMSALDLGCGGGDVTLEIARRIGPDGAVTGIDMDPVALDLARQEADTQGISNVDYVQQDLAASLDVEPVDFVHMRFLLSHIAEPAALLARVFHRLKPGGRIAVMDVEFRAHFSVPDSAALHRYVDLYTRVVAATGGDANIGPRLTGLLHDAGFQHIRPGVDQPTGKDTEIKLMNPVTLERIAPSVLKAGLASGEELHKTIRALYAQARDPGYVQATPRVFQILGRKP